MIADKEVPSKFNLELVRELAAEAGIPAGADLGRFREDLCAAILGYLRASPQLRREVEALAKAGQRQDYEGMAKLVERMSPALRARIQAVIDFAEQRAVEQSARGRQQPKSPPPPSPDPATEDPPLCEQALTSANEIATDSDSTGTASHQSRGWRIPTPADLRDPDPAKRFEAEHLMGLLHWGRTPEPGRKRKSPGGKEHTSRTRKPLLTVGEDGTKPGRTPERDLVWWLREAVRRAGGAAPNHARHNASGPFIRFVKRVLELCGAPPHCCTENFVVQMIRDLRPTDGEIVVTNRAGILLNDDPADSA